MTQSRSQLTAYVIAGCNGAGKTTFARRFLPEFADCRQFLNADLIAAGLSPFAPETQNVRAARLLLERIKELRKARENFGFETTLAGRGYARLLTNMRAEGYKISLSFLWLPTPELALVRVANRVSQGGHSVPEPDIRRRWASGLGNFFQLYRSCVDTWSFYDASRPRPELIAREIDGKLILFHPELFDLVSHQYMG